MMMQQIENLSRRGVLRLGGLAALLASPFRRLVPDGDGAGGGSAGGDGLTPYADVKYALTGGWTMGPPYGFRVTVQFAVADANKQVRLAVSTSASMTPASTFGPVTIDGDGLAKFVVTGLTQPLTQYTCRVKEPLTTSLFGDPFNGWTGPAAAEADYEFDIVLGSCLANAKFVDEFGSQQALEDAANFNAPLFLHLGDWGYWGQNISATGDNPPPSVPDSYKKDLEQYTQTLTDPRLSQLRRLVHGSNIDVCISDHELHANGDIWSKNPPPQSPPDAHDCEHSKRQMVAHRKLFPVKVWGDTSPMAHRGYYTDLAPHVRLVVSDLRSPERNESADPDTNAKQLFGTAQEYWLFNIAFNVPSDVTILFVNETVWWRRGDKDTDDKPASYPNAQTRFINRLKGIGDYAGYPPIIDRFIWLGGDRHYCGHLKSADAGPDKFPQFIGSGFLKNSLQPDVDNEHMSWRTPVRTDPYAWFPISGYTRLHLKYTASPTKKVTLTGIARIVPKTHREITDATLYNNNSTLVTTGSQQFTPDDVGRLISGDGVKDLIEGFDETDDTGHTIIATYNSPYSVNMNKAADHGGNPAVLAIADKPASWPAIEDYPQPPSGPAVVEILL